MSNNNNNNSYFNNIGFYDLLTLATIGRWSRVNGASFNNLYFNNRYKDKDIDDEIKRKYNFELTNNVAKKFYDYLTQTECNIKGKLIVSLDNIDDDTGLIYNVHLEDENRDLKVILEEGDLIDHADEISIIDGNIKRKYEIVLDELRKISDIYYEDGKSSYCRYYRQNGVGFDVLNGEDNVYVYIQYPYEIIDDINPNKSHGLKKPLVFTDEHEAKLRDYFSNITFPIDQDEVLASALEMTMIKDTKGFEYPEISIEVSKRTVDISNGRKWYNNDITSKFVMRYGDVAVNTKKELKSKEDVKKYQLKDGRVQDRKNKVALALKYNIDLSFVDGPDQVFWDAVWDKDSKKSGKRM